jgi:hypothetical protein
MGERRSVLKTIRLPESLVRSLEKEAADEGLTVNADINSILSYRFDWHKKAQEFGFVEILRTVFMSLTEGLDDEKLARIGREVVPGVWKEMAEYWFQDPSPEGIMKHFMIRAKFNPYNRTRITQEEGNYTLVLRHEFGPKWSIIAKNALQEFGGSRFMSSHGLPWGNQWSQPTSRSIRETYPSDRNRDGD